MYVYIYIYIYIYIISSNLATISSCSTMSIKKICLTIGHLSLTDTQAV